MPTGTIRMHSRALATETTYSIILPDPLNAGPGPYPVLLQLHGRFDDHTAWIQKSQISLYVDRIPLIVVMPSGGNFWWSNYRLRGQGGDSVSRDQLALDYEDFIMRDLYEHVEASFAVRADQRWAVGGLSMGGFGAIHLGLKHPHRFCSIWAHSSVIPDAGQLAEWLDALTPAARADMDCYRLAETRNALDLPRLSFDCGVDDFLIDHNRRFHTHLDRLGLPHSYAEHPGAHTWDYWDLHVREGLEQHCEVLGIAPLPPPPPPAPAE